MGQSMRVTVDAAMRARDVCRIRPCDEAPEEPPPPPPQPAKARRAERRRLAKRRGGQT